MCYCHCSLGCAYKGFCCCRKNRDKFDIIKSAQKGIAGQKSPVMERFVYARHRVKASTTA